MNLKLVLGKTRSFLKEVLRDRSIDGTTDFTLFLERIDVHSK
jgi:hypothetical protein